MKQRGAEGVSIRHHLLPPWIIFHVPHASTHIPNEYRDQFLLDNAALADEIMKMTDHHTDWLFTSGLPTSQVVQAPISRLLVDMERFPDDAEEPMAARGMGVVYQRTSAMQPLRRILIAAEREQLLETYYRPHHARLQRCVSDAIAQHGRALVIDCHSFPERPLPYEPDQRASRPQICIGTDDYHTPPALQAAMQEGFAARGFQVAINRPFAGALVPLLHYRRERRVQAVMIEVRRDLYIDEVTAALTDTATDIRRCIAAVLQDVIPALDISQSPENRHHPTASEGASS